MTVLLATGFEHGTHKIVPASYYGGATADASSAHTGSYGLHIYNGFWAVPITSVSSVYLSFWFKPVSLPSSNTFIVAYDGTSPQVGIYLSPTLVWSAAIGGSTTIATASTPLPDYEWHHYKLYIYINDSLGRVKLDIDSISVMDFTGDTKPSTSSTTNKVYFNASNVNRCYLDDLIIDDAQNWVDVRFNGLIPNSDVTTDWTPSTGSTHYTLVDEVPYNDADYLETNTDAQQEVYGLTDWTGTNKTPQMTVTWVRALKTTADTQKLKLIVKSGATTDVGAAQDVYTSATYLNRIDETDPNTGVAWTDSGVDAMQIGYESEI